MIGMNAEAFILKLSEVWVSDPIITQRKIIGPKVVPTCHIARMLLLLRKGDITKSDLLKGLSELVAFECLVGEGIVLY